MSRARRRSWLLLVATRRRGVAFAALSVVALTPAAYGQGITNLTATKNAGNSANGYLGTSTRESAIATDYASSSAFRTRYTFVNANNDLGSEPIGASLNASYRVQFNVTVPGAYDLLVTTRRNFGFRLHSYFGSGFASMSGIAGSQSGGTLSGAVGSNPLGFDAPAGLFSPGAYSNLDATNPVVTISGFGNGFPVAHQLNFDWTMSCFTFQGTVCAQFGGLDPTLQSFPFALRYPGSPPRTASDDGHIVEVTLISYCGDGIVQADKGETCDEGAANGGVSCCKSNCTLAPSGATCRNAAGGCDAVETCDGVDAACPADVIATAGATCRASAGVCDTAETCDGTTTACPADAKSTAQCRASTDPCDPAEICDGGGDDCPADVLLSDGTDCDDGAFCNGADACTAGVCGGAVNPCPTTLCDEASRACFVGGCPLVPRVCGAAAKNKLLLKNQSDDAKDKLVWKWANGTATTQEHFGDPVVDADYALCFYAGATPTLIEELSVPADGGKWSASGSKGYKYSDPSAANGGVSSIILKGGDDGRSKAMVKGKGPNLPDFDGLVPVPASDLPLIVQLRNNANDRCWSGSFANPKQLGQFNGAGTP